jgi:hypothetical protein
MPHVELADRYDGTKVLKAAGSFVAGLAGHRSAEPNSLVVRCEFGDREWLLDEAPETYYVTDYYEKYPVVLVRLSDVTEDAVRDLLAASRRMALDKGRRASTPCTASPAVTSLR